MFSTRKSDNVDSQIELRPFEPAICLGIVKHQTSGVSPLYLTSDLISPLHDFLSTSKDPVA